MHISFADRLQILPSEFRAKANSMDVAEMLALDMVRNEKWRKNYENEKELKASKLKTDQQRSSDIDKLLGVVSG